MAKIYTLLSTTWEGSVKKSAKLVLVLSMSVKAVGNLTPMEIPLEHLAFTAPPTIPLLHLTLPSSDGQEMEQTFMVAIYLCQHQDMILILMIVVDIPMVLTVIIITHK